MIFPVLAFRDYFVVLRGSELEVKSSGMFSFSPVFMASLLTVQSLSMKSYRHAESIWGNTE